MKSYIAALRKLTRGFTLSLLSLIATVFLLNVGLPLFVPVTDYPLIQASEDVGVVYVPNQDGHWVRGATGEVNGHFHTNAQGWHDTEDYDYQPDAYRIAVIGDSFVDAREVDTDRAFSALMEPQVASACGPTQIYRLGFYGAPFSQYIHVIDYAQEHFHPDAFVILTTGNDYDESLAPAGYPWYWRLIADSGSYREIAPVVRIPTASERWRNTFPLWRFLNGNVYWNYLLFGDPADSPPPPLDAAAVALIPYLFSRTVALADGAPVLLVMEQDRTAMYSGAAPTENSYYPYVAAEAARQNIPVLRLDDVLMDDYRQQRQRFEFSNDWHWNEHGHRVVADAISEWISTHWCSEPVTMSAVP